MRGHAQTRHKLDCSLCEKIVIKDLIGEGKKKGDHILTDLEMWALWRDAAECSTDWPVFALLALTASASM